MTKKNLMIILAVFTVTMASLGVMTISEAYDRKDNYYHSETYSSLDKNAYVGGDAYNYIINGTYFTGYMVQGMGFLIMSTISGVVLLLCTCDFQKKVENETVENIVAEAVTEDVTEEEKLPEL